MSDIKRQFIIFRFPFGINFLDPSDKINIFFLIFRVLREWGLIPTYCSILQYYLSPAACNSERGLHEDLLPDHTKHISCAVTVFISNFGEGNGESLSLLSCSESTAST